MTCGKPFDRGAIPGKCPLCGTVNTLDAKKCVGCGSLLPEDGPQPMPMARPLAKPASGSLTAAAVLLMIAGVLAIAQCVILFMMNSKFVTDSSLDLGCCAMISLLFGAIAVMAGYSVMKRSNFVFVIVGCLIAVLSVGFIVGSILALVALVLVAMHKDEF